MLRIVVLFLVLLFAGCSTVNNTFYVDNGSTVNSTVGQTKNVNTTPSITATIPESTAQGLTGLAK